MHEITPGKYRHYKGYDYDVLGVARIEASLELVVVYRALYNAPDFGPDALWVRPLTEFAEIVELDGKMVPRFKKIDD